MGQSCVRRIQNPEDKDIEKTAILYNDLFSDNANLLRPFEIIQRWLQEYQTEREEKRNRSDDYLFITKVRNRVCGLLYCHYYLQSGFMFVSHFGVDKEIRQAREYAAKALVQKLHKTIRREHRYCKGVIFEIEKPQFELGKRENDERRARKRNFKMSARNHELAGYEMMIEYVQPRLSLGGDFSDETLSLMYVPLKPICQGPRHRAYKRPTTSWTE